VIEGMPKPVWWFEKLMWGSLLLGAVNAALDWNRLIYKAVHRGANVHIPDYLLAEQFRIMSVFAFFVAAATVLFLLLLVWLIARRRIGWVRWLFGALCVLGLPSLFTDLPETLSANPLVALLKALQTVMQLTALVLIFLPSARPWFAKPAVGVASA